jgi:hypothetical protein
VQNNPLGYFDLIQCNANAPAVIYGWAGDPNNPNVPVTIHVYIDSTPTDANPASLIGTADIAAEPGPCQALGGTNCGVCPADQPQCKHRFAITIPPVINRWYGGTIDMSNGGSHTIHVYAINATGTPGTNREISNSPQVMSCPAWQACGGRVVTASNTNVGVPGAVIDLYNDGNGTHTLNTTDANGYWYSSGTVSNGQTYAVRPTGVPTGYSTPQTTTAQYVWNNCPPAGDQAVGSWGYECQLRGTNDCCGFNALGEQQ